MDDLISRQQAIKRMAEAIWHYPNELYSRLNGYENAEALAKYGLEYLPSAQNTGKWIDSGYGVECSLCGEWYPHASIARNQLNFCPNCGADMREKKKTLNEIRSEYGLPPINKRGDEDAD